MSAGVDRLERERVVEVDVGDHRDRRLHDDPLERPDVLVARNRAAHEIPARLGDGVDLLHGGVEVRGLRLGHGLHRDRSPAADLDPTTSICFLEAMKPASKARRLRRLGAGWRVAVLPRGYRLGLAQGDEQDEETAAAKSEDGTSPLMIVTERNSLR